MVLSGGMNIYSKEVEQVLLARALDLLGVDAPQTM